MPGRYAVRRTVESGVRPCQLLDAVVFVPPMAHSQPPVWIGLGGNLGAVEEHLRAARLALRAVALGPLVESPLVRSAPWGPVPQPDFLNQVVGLVPRLGPEAMLARLQAVEQAHGRQREVRWGPRTLDLDLLWWPGARRTSVALVLPHPHLAERRFVLMPWAAVAPEVEVEGVGRVAALLAACTDPGPVVWHEAS